MASSTANSRDEGCDVAPITDWGIHHVGIDFDTNAIHLVKLGEDGCATYTCCELIGADAFERTRQVRCAMPTASYWDDVVAVAIEEPQGVQKATVAKLKAVQGAVLACLPRTLLVEPMVPARWRAVCGISGKASKEDVKDAVAGHMLSMHSPQGLLHPDMPQDVWDAYALALAVSRLVEIQAA